MKILIVGQAQRSDDYCQVLINCSENKRVREKRFTGLKAHINTSLLDRKQIKSGHNMAWFMSCCRKCQPDSLSLMKLLCVLKGTMGCATRLPQTDSYAGLKAPS